MAGIYLHIPFCKQKCAYCNFYSKPLHGEKNDDFIKALLTEINHLDCNGKEAVETVYFGGGTPSLLRIEDVKTIFEALSEKFLIKSGAEITFEANPESLSQVYLEALRNKTPVNRLSIGVQSFFQDDLDYLNRRHSPEQALSAIQQAKNTGFSNLSLDLIYGIPTLSEDQWKRNLNLFFDLDIPHLSCYALTVEPETVLDKRIKKGLSDNPKDETLEKHFYILSEAMAKHGFEHYEVSNFCKNQRYARHNSNYWKGIDYYGFGPSAHSLKNPTRYWNIADVDAYIQGLNTGRPISEQEDLTPDMRFNEYVMTAIRTQWGFSKAFVLETFGTEKLNHLLRQLSRIPSDWVEHTQAYIRTSRQGILFADRIAVELFL